MKFYNQEHWGNCLTVALMAKFRDWKNIKIIYLSPEENDSGGWPHFMWHDLLDNNVYDFNAENGKNIWSKGVIRVRPYEAYLRWLKKDKSERT